MARNDAGNWTSGIVGIGCLAGSMRGISAAPCRGSPDDVTPSVMRTIDHATFVAIVKIFSKSLKTEWFWRQNSPTRRQAASTILQYINGFYNPLRHHSYLGGMSSIAFES